MWAAELAERLVGSSGDLEPYILLGYLDRRADEAEVWARPTPVRARRA
jgi:hypothetical protein